MINIIKKNYTISIILLITSLPKEKLFNQHGSIDYMKI